MSTVTSEHFGELELNHGLQHCFRTAHAVHGMPVELELNFTAHDKADQAAVHKVDFRLRYLPDVVDQVRELLVQELSLEDSPVREYRHFHCQGLSTEQLRQIFGVTAPEDLSDELFIKALTLGHVGIFPAQPERYFVLDLSLGRAFTDEVLIVTADADGVLDDEIVWA
ncbi:DUF2004 domain-containing protein [Psychromicrobium xiongbiense]|uniref:DUF2004 domain-containing protein n=1 Tax=Psychromicrobium xiongbiense TaxID=3051184 RepID=UPI0025558682|nr:DUF2004 domain-containing protein [Psychromicrobium sp. YIM S02556]